MPAKKVFEGPLDRGAEIGAAASWAEVEEILIGRGLTRRAAQAAVMTRGVEGRDAFHILTATADLDALCAQAKAVAASRDG